MSTFTVSYPFETLLLFTHVLFSNLVYYHFLFLWDAVLFMPSYLANYQYLLVFGHVVVYGLL